MTMPRNVCLLGGLVALAAGFTLPAAADEKKGMPRMEKLEIKRADSLKRDKPPATTAGTVSADAVLEKMNPNYENGHFHASAKPVSPIPSPPKQDRDPTK